MTTLAEGCGSCACRYKSKFTQQTVGVSTDILAVPAYHRDPLWISLPAHKNMNLNLKIRSISHRWREQIHLLLWQSVICKQKYDFISPFGNHSNNKCQRLCAFVCVCIAFALQCVRSCGTEREREREKERWVDPVCSLQPYLREMNRLIMACRRLQRIPSQDMDTSHLACGRFWGCYHSSNKLGFQGNSK